MSYYIRIKYHFKIKMSGDFMNICYMTIGVGISQKKNIKKFDLVTILWFDPYVYLCKFLDQDNCQRHDNI